MTWPKHSQVAVRNNISKRWNTADNDVSKNQSSADTAIRLPNTKIRETKPCPGSRELEESVKERDLVRDWSEKERKTMNADGVEE
ncbi:hypothetical protein TNCV_5019151 [Trichonephila clavipes]|nr:hypothetical protein TNCV_5019151 [Trichonephila clavipes]